MPIDRLDDVRVFRQVAASGSLTGAARALGTTKNRVSQRLRALEEALGLTLAHRTTRQLRLTEEGERFLTHSAAVLEAAERVEQMMGSPASVSGRVRVAVRSALLGRGLGAELSRLLQSAPKLKLQVEVIDEEADLLAAGVDLAIFVGELRDSSMLVTRLEVSSFVLAATREYLDAHGRPRSPDDLVKHQCIRKLSQPPERTWPLVDRHGRRVDAPIAGALECSDAQLQAEALYAGFGIGLRPLDEVRRAEAAGTLERVLPGFRHRPFTVWLASPAARSRIPRVAAVAELLKRVVGRFSE